MLHIKDLPTGQNQIVSIYKPNKFDTPPFHNNINEVEFIFPEEKKPFIKKQDTGSPLTVKKKQKKLKLVLNEL